MTPSARRRSAGFSLLELMVTMGIATMLLGTGAAVYMKMGRRSAATRAIASVGEILTRARTASARFPATVVPDPNDGLIHAYVDETLQELHFEARPLEKGEYVPLGIEGRDVKLAGAQVVADTGRVGGGLQVDGGSVDCGNFAAYDVTDGFNAELWIKPSAAPKCDLVTKGRAFRIRLLGLANRAGKLTIEMRLQDAAGTQEAISRDVAIPPVRVGEWMGVRVGYDRTALVTEVSQGHGFVLVDRWADEARRPMAKDEEAPLVLVKDFSGHLDDVRIGGLRAPEPLRLPVGVTLVPPVEPIRFDSGRLDPALHSGPARLSIAYDGKISTFEIGQAGTVLAVHETEGAPPPVEKKRDEQSAPAQKKE